jgi:hypothetical protein
MKLFPIAALALFAATPAFAGSSFLVDFENDWAYGTTVDNTYSSLGVSFTNVLGLSNNDGLGSLPNGDYYQNAPSTLGVAYGQLDGVVNTAAYMNVAGGVDNALSFYYSSAANVSGAVKAYSGLNGSGTLLGSFDLTANSNSYDNWTAVTFAFAGTAQSFDLTGAANSYVGFDNIAAVPEASTYAMLLAGLGMLGFAARRNRR